MVLRFRDISLQISWQTYYPKHPYTKALLSSSPSLLEIDEEPIELTGELPSPLNPPTGCHFHKRCPFVTDECKISYPESRNVEGREVSCHIV